MAVGPIPVTTKTSASAAKPTAPKPTSTPAKTTTAGGYSGIPAAKTTTTGGYSGIPTTTKPVTSTPTKSTGGKTGGTTTSPYNTTGPFNPQGGVGTGGYGPSSTPAAAPETSTFIAAGTFAGYEISADGKTRRARFHDGKGGFYYGSSESNPDYQETTLGTTNVQVLKAVLLAKGFPADLVEDSVPFLTTLLKEGIDAESSISIYLNTKSFTTKAGTVITSPFYNKYGFYNDALTEKYDASTLFNTVEGYKNVASKYALDAKFTSQDYIQKYLKNKRSVAALDKDANTARLLAVNSDPLKVKTLQTLGFINNAQDLTDFYLDPNVGTEKMQQNVNTAAFAIEAIRRANTLAPFSKTAAEQYGAQFTAQGLDEGTVTAIASKGYQNIAGTLEPEVKYSGIFERDAAANQATIQAELEAEEFKGLESERRKRLAELATRSFQGQSGITTQSLSTGMYQA